MRARTAILLLLGLVALGALGWWLWQKFRPQPGKTSIFGALCKAGAAYATDGASLKQPETTSGICKVLEKYAGLASDAGGMLFGQHGPEVSREEWDRRQREYAAQHPELNAITTTVGPAWGRYGVPVP